MSGGRGLEGGVELTRRGISVSVCLGLAVALLLGLAPAGVQAKAAKHPRPAKHLRPAKHPPKAAAQVREIPVHFTVINQDASLVSCQTDGRTYAVAGTLFLPPGRSAPAGVTLYAHGLGYAGYFWDFTAVPGYDYAGYEAAHGHASVVIDRLGYGASGKPEGNASCIGGQATVLHEIIGDLRSGSYSAAGATHPRFSRIGLVGHSIGGMIAEVEAYSFGDIDALGVMDWDDADYSPMAYSTFGSDVAGCGTGGKDQSAGGPDGYGPFGATTADYDAIMFHGIAPAVEAAANAMRTLDPCGDITSVLEAAAIDATKVAAINVPIVFVWGSDDAIFPDQLPWAQTQEALYRASPKVTNLELAGSGHAVTLELNAPLLQREMSAWLTANRL